MINKKAEVDPLIVVVILVAIGLAFLMTMSIVGYFSMNTACDSFGGHYTTGGCVKDGTLYSLANTNPWGFIPKYEVVKQAVSNK